MALQKCRECGKEISTQAASCPQCGAPKKKSGCLNQIALLMLLLVGVIYVMAKITSPTVPPEVAAQNAAKAADARKAK